jgi:hypothetical protein
MLKFSKIQDFEKDNFLIYKKNHIIMAKFTIKESSITSDVNQKSLDLIKGELSKHLNGINFTMTVRQGNYAYWESNDFTAENYNLGSSEEGLKSFLNNILNFRYENFKIHFEK